jgi:hypothetical protein
MEMAKFDQVGKRFKAISKHAEDHENPEKHIEVVAFRDRFPLNSSIFPVQPEFPFSF